MTEADRAYTPEDDIAVRQFLGIYKPGMESPIQRFNNPFDYFPRNTHASEREPLTAGDLLERFFAEHFIEEPGSDTTAEGEKFYSGFTFWQDTNAGELWEKGDLTSIEEAEIISSLTTSQAYEFARGKEKFFRIVHRNMAKSNLEKNNSSEEIAKWKRRAEVAFIALQIESSRPQSDTSS